ncbi:MAG: NIPSNAP family protein [Trueperaceae bacterium]
MITCFLEYDLDTTKLTEFEDYAKKWIPLVNKFGGTHHGYFMPSEGVSDKALALFTFPSLADYERYRQASFQDPECQVLFQFAKETQCFTRYNRSFFRPVFE